MNKKFSTLLAGLMLASVAATAAPSHVKLKLGSNEGLYQITTDTKGEKVIVMDADGKLSAVAVSDLKTGKDLASSLWCIHVDGYDQGQTPKFDFTNKLHGRVLDINMDDPALMGLEESKPSGQLQVGGTTAGWAFSTTYANGVEIEKPMFSYFKPDSIVYLTVGNGGHIVAQKEGANKAAPGSMTKFSLQIPTQITLNASDLNTMLGTNADGKSFKLNFSKVANPNVFANELIARDTTISGVKYQLITNKSTGNYLRVDTAFNSTTGYKFLQLTDTTSAVAYEDAWKKSQGANKLRNNMGTENYVFSFRYSPASDSVYVDVRGAILNKTTGYWEDSPWTSAAGNSTPAESDSLHVFIQDLTDNACVLTVGNYISKITLGFGTCTPVASTKTTVPSDLYVIKSADGKYLAVPIHGDTTAQWVTLEKNVKAWTMPSFQWVVEKNIKNSDISQIKITNREFGAAVKVFNNVQLDKVTSAVLVDQKGVSKGVNPGGFLAATAAIKADSLLGYKYLNPEELLVTRYKFRYLHEFSDDYYAGVNQEVNDSILYVGAKSSFALKVKDNLYTYGYTSSAVAGLKPLYRQSYTLKIRNAKLIFGATADSVVLDKEGRFAVSEKVSPLTFLIKTNNQKAISDVETLFYAFLKLGADTTKMGTDDNNLWLKNQIMSESRTSAFSVEVDESPLYRRFWTEKEGEANDNPDTVKFFRVNNPADMLFEDAHSVYSEGKEINFLGVNNNMQFPNAKRAIYVDTAYVNRGTGYIKPQYMLAVDVNIIPGTEAVPCPLEHNHGFDKDGNALDKWTCSHATPGTDGYVRGRYLINTVDSAKVDGNYKGEVSDADYIWNNQVRLAFVEAIHKKDTLYILNGSEAALPDPVDLSKLNTKIRLDNNKHKNVVFSFRLLEEGSDNFLIESAETDGAMIAPMKGGWVKIQNGVPVVSYAAFEDRANESEIFNVVKTSETPTENATISTSEVTVQTIAGAVIVKNAAGKSVKVSNILGQPVAETVLTSDNATINVPAGIVVVAVEGEEAVKTVVK